MGSRGKLTSDNWSKPSKEKKGTEKGQEGPRGKNR